MLLARRLATLTRTGGTHAEKKIYLHTCEYITKEFASLFTTTYMSKNGREARSSDEAEALEMNAVKQSASKGKVGEAQPAEERSSRVIEDSSPGHFGQGPCNI